LDFGYAVPFAVIACLCSAGYLVALLAAGVACRKGFRMPRFMGWFSVTLAVLPFVICLPFLLIAMLSIGAMIGWDEMVSAAMYCAVVCLGVSVAMLVMTLPILWFGFRSPVYRVYLAHIYGIPELEPEVATASAEGGFA
jgi:hypothetical protein